MASYMSDAGLDAISNFFSLGLQHYAVNLTLEDRECAIATALSALATKPTQPGLPHGGPTTLQQSVPPAAAQHWEGFDPGKLQKRRKEIRAPRGSAFRSQLSSASAAAEHAAGKPQHEHQGTMATDLQPRLQREKLRPTAHLREDVFFFATRP